MATQQTGHTSTRRPQPGDEEEHVANQGKKKKKVHLTPYALARKMPQYLVRIRPLLAMAPYCAALLVGLACVVLIALVVVTFDTATTEQWILATLISLCTKWFSEPLQVMINFA